MAPPDNHHPSTRFSLVPLNDRAKAATAHPNNAYIARKSDDGKIVLDIWRVLSTSGDTTLATLGRTGDVFVEGSNISRIQCSFEVHPDTGLVMFQDRSRSHTTQVFGENVIQFAHGRPRKVVLFNDTQTIIGFGGEHQDLVQFEVKWPHEAPQREMALAEEREENPRQAQTIDQDNTALPSQRQTRIHASQLSEPKLRWRPAGEELGRGRSSVVFKAVNCDTGHFFAVKEFNHVASAEQRDRLKREVEILSSMSHVSETSLFFPVPHTNIKF